MDEPTASLTEREVERLFGVIARAARATASASSTSRTGSRRSSPSPTASPCCATARRSRRAPTAGVERARADPADGRARAVAVFPKRAGAARRRSRSRSATLGHRASGVRDVSLRRAARRDPRPRRAGRIGTDRAGRDAVRPDAGRCGRDPDRRPGRQRSRSPARRDRARHRLRARGSPPARRRARDVGRGQHQPGQPVGGRRVMA